MPGRSPPGERLSDGQHWRHVNQVQSTGAAGEITTRVNLHAIPQPTGFVAAAPGDVWYCQLWSRDSVAGGPTSSFTDAVSVTIR